MSKWTSKELKCQPTYLIQIVFLRRIFAGGNAETIANLCQLLAHLGGVVEALLVEEMLSAPLLEADSCS